MKKKTMLAGILSACIVGSGTVLSLTGSAADKVYGDANLDGSVDMSDCVLVMQSLPLTVQTLLTFRSAATVSQPTTPFRYSVIFSAQ